MRINFHVLKDMEEIQECNKHPIDTRRLFETVIWSAPARPGGTLVRKRLLSLSNNRMSPPSKVRCCWQWKISSGHPAATPGAAQTALMLLTPQREQIWRHCTRFRGNVIWVFKSQLGLAAWTGASVWNCSTGFFSILIGESILWSVHKVALEPAIQENKNP